MSRPDHRVPDYRTARQKIADLMDAGVPAKKAKKIVAREELRYEIGQIENLEDVRRVLFTAFPEIVP